MQLVGTVSELRRYPVKSMLGEMLESVDVEQRGFAGDRVCALIDRTTGKVASAKLPKQWRRLLEFQAIYDPDLRQVEIILPGGASIDAADAGAAELISGVLGRDVTVTFERSENLTLDRAIPDDVEARGLDSEVGFTILELGAAAPAGGFFDLVPIHFVTSASLEKAAERSFAGVPEAARYRPNIVIESMEPAPFAETDWVGSTLAIGDALRLKVLVSTPRCALVTLAQGDLKSDPKLVRSIAQLHQAPVLDMGLLPCLGAYAQIDRPGAIALGDPVILQRA